MSAWDGLVWLYWWHNGQLVSEQCRNVPAAKESAAGLIESHSGYPDHIADGGGVITRYVCGRWV